MELEHEDVFRQEAPLRQDVLISTSRTSLLKCREWNKDVIFKMEQEKAEEAI